MEAEKAGLYAKGQMGQSLSAKARRGDLGPVAQANLNTDGNRPESWATPNAGDGKAGMAVGRVQKSLGQDVSLASGGYKETARLNPRWVETLMGLPVGWVMPSCQSPVTAGLTSSDSSVTESSQLRAA